MPETHDFLSQMLLNILGELIHCIFFYNSDHLTPTGICQSFPPLHDMIVYILRRISHLYY